MGKGTLLIIGLAVLTASCKSERGDAAHLSHQFIVPQRNTQEYSPLLYNNNLNTQPQQQLESSTPSEEEIVTQQIAINVLALSQEITRRKLESRTTTKYEVLSPISVTSALHLAFLGSKGKTFEELKKLLNYSHPMNTIHRQFGEIMRDLQTNEANPNRNIVNWRKRAGPPYVNKYMRMQDKNPNYVEHKIEMANGIFVQNDVSLRRAYLDVVKRTYQSDIESLDFRSSPEKSAQFINNWVSLKTHGKIPTIVPPVMNPNTRIVLANALYFNAEWQTNFIEGATSIKKFYPNGRDTEPALDTWLMAHGGKFPHNFDPETNSDIIGFPYKQNSTTMYVILPKNSNTFRLRDVQAKLTAEKIDSLIDGMTLKTAVVLFPKMHLTSSHYLKEELKNMDLKSLFDENQSDLSLIIEDQAEGRKNYNRGNRDYSERITFRGDVNTRSRQRRNVISYKTPSEDKNKQATDFKSFLLKKRIVKGGMSEKKKISNRRSKREALEDLEKLRDQLTVNNAGLFADEVIHKVDLNINEKGTEGGAATAITLNRSGTQVVFRADTPFLFLIRHDPTKIPLFYGAVLEPPPV